jgi:tetratricopeptide (TPR) repeat protein
VAKDELGQLQEALADLARAAELEPDNVGVLIASGVLKNKLLRHEEALVDLSRAAALQPDRVDIRQLLEATHLALRRPEEALAGAERAGEPDDVAAGEPDDVAALITRAGAHMQQRNFDRALEDLEQVLARDPNNLEALHLRGVVAAAAAMMDKPAAAAAAAMIDKPAAAMAGRLPLPSAEKGLRFRLQTQDYTSRPVI